MSNIILYQYGDRSRDPKNGLYYNPWDNHIWDCVKQVRIWNPEVDFFIITDYEKEDTNFEKYNVKKVPIKDIDTRHEIEKNEYFINSINPSERACGIRSFYIESLMMKYDLKNTFTFDNDVLIYFDIEIISSILERMTVEGILLTATSMNEMTWGMCYVKDVDRLSKVNDVLWDLLNSDINMIDMGLWSLIYKKFGSSLVDFLPTWNDGQFSEKFDSIGGIFDPSSIGQFLLGCDNGSSPGTLFNHHYIHNQIKKGTFSFEFDTIDSKKIIKVSSDDCSSFPIFSIHVHNKKLKELMSC